LKESLFTLHIVRELNASAYPLHLSQAMWANYRTPTVGLYPSLPAGNPVQTLSPGHPGEGLSQYPCPCQSDQGLADLCRFRSNPHRKSQKLYAADSFGIELAQPSVPWITHPSEAGFILKHQPPAEADLRFLDRRPPPLREIFLNSPCNAGSLFGCFVSGCIFRQL